MRFYTWLRNLFSSKNTLPSSVIQTDGEFELLHEDYVGRVELLPARILDKALMKNKMSSYFKTTDPINMDRVHLFSIYLKEAHNPTIRDKGILVTDLQNQLIKKGFSLKDLRYVGSKDQPTDDFVLSRGSMNWYGTRDGKYLSSVYLNGFKVGAEDLEEFNTLLFELCKQFNLILLDWWKEELFNTRLFSEVEVLSKWES